MAASDIGIELAELLRPLADGDPGGLDLSQDPDRRLIEQAFDRTMEEPTPSDANWERIVGMIEQSHTGPSVHAPMDWPERLEAD